MTPWNFLAPAEPTDIERLAQQVYDRLFAKPVPAAGEPLSFPHMRIICGTLTASDDAREVGTFMYFVEFVETDGETIVWEGPDFAAAVLAAAEWDLPVIEGGM